MQARLKMAVTALALGLGACALAPQGPPASAGDCMTVRLWSNGWHTNLAVPASIFQDDHALRRLYPDARYFLIGWGDRDYYIDPDPGVWKAVKAALAPTPSVVQVFADDIPVEDQMWRGSDVITIAVSLEGAEMMAEGVTRTLRLDPDGEPVVAAEGRAPEASAFLHARPRFHLFYMCNHWTAQRLREAGLKLNPHISFTAPGLMNAVSRRSAEECPS